MKILFVISEVEGLVKTGGLADVGKALPIALGNLGHDVRIVMPYYRQLQQHDFTLLPEMPQMPQGYGCRIYHAMVNGVSVYALEHNAFFERDGLYSDQYHAYADNGERFTFFSLAALAAAKALQFQPDILHCHDWHTALCAYLVKQDSSGFFAHTSSVLTIHNGAFQGQFSISGMPILEHIPQLASQQQSNGLNFLAMGIQASDKIVAVSPTYARELVTHLGGHGLDGLLRERQADLSGILNGCDYLQWDPAHDAYLAANYQCGQMQGKNDCKQALQKEVGLPEWDDVPLLAMVCRITEQKGFGYLLPILSELLSHNIQLLILGTGDPRLCEQLAAMARVNPSRFVFCNRFSPALSHQLEAGCDFFLMPSQFEPCGLNQMYSLAYGSVPIVRAVGGLRDTVIDHNGQTADSTGFVFVEPEPQALLACIRRALLFYHEDKAAFAAMRRRAMASKFTWQASAGQYQQLFLSCVE